MRSRRARLCGLRLRLRLLLLLLLRLPPPTLGPWLGAWSWGHHHLLLCLLEVWLQMCMWLLRRRLLLVGRGLLLLLRLLRLACQAHLLSQAAGRLVCLRCRLLLCLPWPGMAATGMVGLRRQLAEGRCRGPGCWHWRGGLCSASHGMQSGQH
jgi:hypothetical protein